MSVRKAKLAVALTASEIAERAEEIAIAIGELEAVEAEKKAVNAEFAEKLKNHKGRISELSGEVRHRKTFRMVDVYDELDANGQIVRTIRRDTGEIIDKRQAHDGDRQLDLDA